MVNAIEDSLRELPVMRDIMNLAKDLINTVRESPKRMHMFQALQSGSVLQQICVLTQTIGG